MKKKISGLGIPLFFILPILGFITSLGNIRSRSSAFVYIAFTALFGYAISFSDPSADSYRYARAFNEFDNTLNYNSIVELYKNGELRDLYRVLLFYFCSVFTNNPKIMYSVAGIIYGTISYLNINLLFDEFQKKRDIYLFSLSLIFFTICSVSNLNGFRFNTGFIFLFYASYQFFIKGNIRWGIGIIVTPLFHYSFVMIVPVLIFYKIIEKYCYTSKGVNGFLYIIFTASFVASFILGTNSIDLGFITRTDALSGAIGQRLDYLNNEEVASMVESRRDESLFLSVQQYFDIGIKVFIFLSVFLMRNLTKRMVGNKTLFTKILSLVLFYYSFAFIATSFPSGSRFMSIGNLFLILAVSRYYNIYRGAWIKKTILFGLIVFSFNIMFVNFMLPYMILSSTFWYGNFFWIIIEGWGFKP